MRCEEAFVSDLNGTIKLMPVDTKILIKFVTS